MAKKIINRKARDIVFNAHRMKERHGEDLNQSLPYLISRGIEELLLCYKSKDFTLDQLKKAIEEESVGYNHEEAEKKLTAYAKRSLK